MNSISSLKDVFEKTGIPEQFLSETAVSVDRKTSSSLRDSYGEIFDSMQELFVNKEELLKVEELAFLAGYKPITKKMDKALHLIGRPDGVIRDGRVSYFELNFTPSIGGINAFSDIQRFFSHRLEGELETPLGALEKYLHEVGPVAVYRRDGVIPRIDVEDRLVIEELAARGAPVQYLDLLELLDRLDEFKTILRFHSYADADEETMGLIDQLEQKAAQKNLNAALSMDQSSYLYSKVFMSFFSEVMDREGLVVWSRWLGNEETCGRPRFRERLELARRDQHRLLVKKDYSNRGRHVFFGDEQTPEAWENLLEQCLKEGDWIIQENSLKERARFSISGDVIERPFIISPYFFGNHFGGTCVRVVMDEEKKVCVMPGTTATAISTVVEERA